MKRPTLFPWVFALSLAARGVQAAGFVVTSIADTGPGTLRQAIMDANAAPGADVVTWNCPGSEREIHLDSALPEIADPLVIDGTTQPGYTGVPFFTVFLPFPTDGLVINATNCAVRGMSLVNCKGGIVLRSTARGAVIGGPNNSDGNWLRYCAEAGIRVEGGSGHVIANNTLTQNYGAGALIVGGVNGLITNNEVTLNGGGGVIVTGGTNHTIRANFMVGNTGLGIDLGGDGLTLNDNDDPDGGPNVLQNFPVISTATFSASGLAVSGTLNSRPNTAFTLDFYANLACDDSGSGEGQQHLGSTNITTANNGNRNSPSHSPMRWSEGSSPPQPRTRREVLRNSRPVSALSARSHPRHSQ